MRATFRPLATWPYPPRKKRASSFKLGWDDSLNDLEREIEAVSGSDVLIGIVVDPSQIGIAGGLKAGARTTVRHPGVEVSFEVGDRRVAFHTDAYPSLPANLRAIALGLEALRAVDRYGITSTGEQYAGFAQLTAGGPDPVRGRRLIEERFAGNVGDALRGTHPDTREAGYTDRDFADVQAARQLATGAPR